MYLTESITLLKPTNEDVVGDDLSQDSVNLVEEIVLAGTGGFLASRQILSLTAQAQPCLKTISRTE